MSKPEEEAAKLVATLLHTAHNIHVRFGFDIEKIGYEGVLHRLQDIAAGNRAAPQSYNVGEPDSVEPQE